MNIVAGIASFAAWGIFLGSLPLICDGIFYLEHGRWPYRDESTVVIRK